MRRKQPLTQEERDAVSKDAVDRLDAELELDVTISTEDQERIRRARENAQAIQGLMESFQLAGEGQG